MGVMLVFVTMYSALQLIHAYIHSKIVAPLTKKISDGN